MTKYLYLLIFTLLFIDLNGQEYIVSSPDKDLNLTFSLVNKKPVYSVTYKNEVMLENSPLGLITSIGDFSQHMTVKNTQENQINKQYKQQKIKQSSVSYKANELIIALVNKDTTGIEIIFRVSNNNIGFRYKIPQKGEIATCIITKEVTGYNFPESTTTFLTPQATPMIGWKNTKPSYEEEYVADEALSTPSKYGIGYTFPALFHNGDKGWILVSETGVSSSYCGAKLSEGTAEGIYSISYPEAGENNGLGSVSPAILLPGATPWRTLTISDTLKPIVETTIPFDLVEPLYEPSEAYKFGRSTWSWIMWQDNSINYEDQIKYIDLSADLGYEYALIDGLWDKQIGYDKMTDLFAYAKSKNVAPFVWYNSNGYWNNAPQGPKNKMNTSIARKKEMKWLQSHGVKGIKVDFFGGDKQETMKLYEDILSDANTYGLMVIFHGCTIPRGWERMYPNYVGSEAVLASENLIFTQKANDMEAFNASLHPFIRNAVGSMEFGPVLLNKRHNKTNDGGQIRKTSDVFQLVTAVLFQSSVQMFAIAPNNLTDVPAFEIDFMKAVPTTWDETVFIDGYPGRYCVLARRHGEQWYIVGINAEDKTLNLKVNLPMLAGKKVIKYGDKKDLSSYKTQANINASGTYNLSIPSNGGLILMN